MIHLSILDHKHFPVSIAEHLSFGVIRRSPSGR